MNHTEPKESPMTSRSLPIRSALLSLALCTTLAARAQQGTATPQAPPAPAAKPAAPPPCTGAAYQQFDFWVGDWAVKDTKTGALLSFDRIEKVNDGCALLMDSHQLDDQFRNPASPHRLHGRSVSAFDGKSWRQVYFDNMGTFISVSGGLDEKGAMVLTGDLRPAANAEIKAVWERNPDGTVHNYGFQRPSGGEWKPFFDVTCHPNRPGQK
jgi:hypothetical protein